MDSPHLLHLSFLVLALAAPRPNVAISIAGPAERTEGSFSGITAVTVYHCEDFKRCTCNSRANSFEKFKKIAETQNKEFSDVIVELVTNETHMTVCFEQANSCMEGIYGVYWEKPGGGGLSCGILNSGENGRGNISTERNICCEAETVIWRHNPTLKCYTQKSRPKPTALPLGIAEGILGNPEFLPSKKNIIGILFAFVVAVVCIGWATRYCSLRLRRRQAFRQVRQDSERESLAHL